MSQAWLTYMAYLCALQGHVWSWFSTNTGGDAPVGTPCQRCGTKKTI